MFFNKYSDILAEILHPMAERKERFTVSRRKKILEHIKETGEVMVTQLSREFNVSEVTIRNDLEHLERKNLLVRARGGAIHTENHVGIDQRITEKHKIHAAEKAAIGKLASSLINDGETIIIDSGTTTAEIVKHLDGIKHLNVITNALNIANLLAAHPAVKGKGKYIKCIAGLMMTEASAGFHFYND